MISFIELPQLKCRLDIHLSPFFRVRA